MRIKFPMMILSLILLFFSGCVSPVMDQDQFLISDSPEYTHYSGKSNKNSSLDITSDSPIVEALKYLEQHTELIYLPDGHSLCGRDLYQFINNYPTPIKWDPNHECQAAACQAISCSKTTCIYENQGQGEVPIIINPETVNNAEDPYLFLVDTIAHEIFHRMQWFGPVDITQYEEFLAIVIAAKITGSELANYEDYDPLQPICLKRWFHNHHLDHYNSLALYPLSVMETMDVEMMDQPCQLPGDTVCIEDQFGLIRCDTYSGQD